MADSNTPMSADPSLLQSLKLHLEGLKRTQHGQILYNQIQRGLQQYGSEDGRIELVFVTFLHALLGKYAMSPACDPATRVKARLIQQRLTLYLPKAPSVFPDEDLDRFDSSSRNELSTGGFRRGIVSRRPREHSSSEICSVPDEARRGFSSGNRMWMSDA